MIDPGEMIKQVSVLELRQTGTDYTWEESASAWAKAEPQDKKNLFSTVGIGVKSVKFTIWKRDLTLHNAFRWQGKHCFLTDITEIDRMYYEVAAALIEPKTCTVNRKTTVKDEFNRPVASEPQVIMTFPGCLTEKYMGFTRLNPQVQIDAQYVLVTPKAVSLLLADLVIIGETTYNVQVLHELDEFKNEYEIAVKKDG